MYIWNRCIFFIRAQEQLSSVTDDALWSFYYYKFLCYRWPFKWRFWINLPKKIIEIVSNRRIELNQILCTLHNLGFIRFHKEKRSSLSFNQIVLGTKKHSFSPLQWWNYSRFNLTNKLVILFTTIRNIYNAIWYKLLFYIYV